MYLFIYTAARNNNIKRVFFWPPPCMARACAGMADNISVEAAASLGSLIAAAIDNSKAAAAAAVPELMLTSRSEADARREDEDDIVKENFTSS